MAYEVAKEVDPAAHVRADLSSLMFNLTPWTWPLNMRMAIAVNMLLSCIVVTYNQHEYLLLVAETCETMFRITAVLSSGEQMLGCSLLKLQGSLKDIHKKVVQNLGQ